MKRLIALALVLAALEAAASSAAAQAGGAPGAGYRPESGVPSSARPPALREIGFDQNLNGQLPLDTPFKDESDLDVKIGGGFGQRAGRPRFPYLDTPMLVTVVLDRPPS